MKKNILLAALLAALLFVASGCGSDATTVEPDTSSVDTSAESSAVEGNVTKYDGFSVMVVDGWEKMDVQGGVQIYKPSGEILQIQIGGENMTEEDDLAQMESLKQNYDGSEIQTLQLLGMDFRMISYSALDVEQSIYTAISGGKQIKIQATGKSYEENSDIRAMVGSIVFN